MNKSYKVTKWVDNKTPINAQNLNNIESGLKNLYENALSADDLVPGDGVTIEETYDGKQEIALDPGVMFSQTCTGIEWVQEIPEAFDKDKIYFILNPLTKELEKIVINGITIFKTN